MHPARTILSVLTLTLLAGAATAEGSASLDVSPVRFKTEPPAPEAKAEEKAKPATAHGAYGSKGSHWLTFGGGAADNFSDAVDTNLHIAWSTFLVENVEFGIEGGGWYFNQPGDNTGGISGTMLFRWHFYNDQNWTVFADVGIGLLGAFDDVPDGGTSFDFMPRAGGGFTKRISEDADTRLMAGVRWHHISNARINGDDNNPSRDGAMFYAALVFPF